MVLGRSPKQDAASVQNPNLYSTQCIDYQRLWCGLTELVKAAFGCECHNQNSKFALAKGDKTHVIVVSIPDYAYTPYGHGSATISAEIEQYNAFAKNYTEGQGVTFINITDITQEGLQNPDLVAGDGLHPSELAYAKFVERILPVAKQIIIP